MKRSEHRILTTHSGSLARPADLLQCLWERASGKSVDQQLLERLTRAAVCDAVKHQVEVGIDVVNDGEQSKVSFASYLKDRLSGFAVEPPAATASHQSFDGEMAEFPEYFARPSTIANERFRNVSRQAVCVGPVAWENFSEVERDIANLEAATRDLSVEDTFVSALSPSLAVNFSANRYYATDDEYLYAIADALKREYRAIADAGFVVQLDLPLAGFRNRVVGSPADNLAALRKQLAHNIEALNYALAEIPAEQARLHVCFGSDAGPHTRDPDLRDIIDVLLSAKPAGITLVGASGRHAHDWRVWEDTRLPDGKVVIVGVIDHTSNIVEHPETVADRIQRYAQVVGKEHLIAGVDCGFDPSAGIEEVRVDRHIAWAKLRSLAEGADLATKALWPR